MVAILLASFLLGAVAGYAGREWYARHLEARRRKAHNLSPLVPGASVVERSSSNSGAGGSSLDGEAV